ncbi:hypothetical protein PaG_02046 [Moesziomyces aphidis]|uniref:Uncharacterized protein n=1 Tax=Moesziomyces aphidis TaxID=84754 RepID=W3VQB1_MOEAP|nr:hypothetical protein PaG_02046 [Moesziomyces aphidis]
MERITDHFYSVYSPSMRCIVGTPIRGTGARHCHTLPETSARPRSQSQWVRHSKFARRARAALVTSKSKIELSWRVWDVFAEPSRPCCSSACARALDVSSDALDEGRMPEAARWKAPPDRSAQPLRIWAGVRVRMPVPPPPPPSSSALLSAPLLFPSAWSLIFEPFWIDRFSKRGDFEFGNCA